MTRASSLRRRLRPVLPVLVSAPLALLLLAVVAALRHDESVPALLLQPVVLVLACGTAYLLDDSAQAVTDVAPRSRLRRRAGAVLGGLGLVAAAWTLAVLLLLGRSPTAPVAALSWELAGLSCLCVAASAVAGRRGDAEPGNLVASGVGLLLVGLVVTQPALHLSILALTGEEPVRAGWWAAVVVASLATATLASRDAAAGRPCRAATG